MSRLPAAGKDGSTHQVALAGAKRGHRQALRQARYEIARFEIKPEDLLLA